MGRALFLMLKKEGIDVPAGGHDVIPSGERSIAIHTMAALQRLQ